MSIIRKFLLISIPLLMTGTPVMSKYCEPDTSKEIDIQNRTIPFGKRWDYQYKMNTYKLIVDGNKEIKCTQTSINHQYKTEIIETIYTCGKLIIKYDGMTMVRPSAQKDPLIDELWWLRDKKQQSFIMNSTPFVCECNHEYDDTKRTGACTKTLSNEFVKMDLIIEEKWMLIDKPRPQI